MVRELERSLHAVFLLFYSIVGGGMSHPWSHDTFNVETFVVRTKTCIGFDIAKYFARDRNIEMRY